MAPSRVKRIVAKSQIARTPITEQHQRLARDALSVRCDHENNSRIASCAHAHALFSFCSEACERKHTTKRNARGRTIPMSGVAVARTDIDADVPTPTSRKRISKRMEQALSHLATKGVNQREAAKLAGLSEYHLSRQLKKPQIQAFIARKSRENIQLGVLRASVRINELVDASSEHVSLDASKHVLAIEGIRPPDQGQVSVNVGVSVGYVIDLTGSRQSGNDAITVGTNMGSEPIDG